MPNPCKKAAAPAACPRWATSHPPAFQERSTKSSTSIREGQGKQPELMPYIPDVDTCDDCKEV
jgi:hypothetical protein